MHILFGPGGVAGLLSVRSILLGLRVVLCWSSSGLGLRLVLLWSWSWSGLGLGLVLISFALSLFLSLHPSLIPSFPQRKQETEKENQINKCRARLSPEVVQWLHTPSESVFKE